MPFIIHGRAEMNYAIPTSDFLEASALNELLFTKGEFSTATPEAKRERV